MRKLDPILAENIENIVNSMGYEFVGGEMVSQGSQMVLRLYIDGQNADGKRGVSLDDCSKVSYQVSAMLDVESPLQGRYFLEVSSPGIDRPLFALKHYQASVGERVKVKLHSPIEQRRQFTGVLQKVDGEDVYLEVEGIEQALVVPFSLIEKANVVSDIFIRKTDKGRRKSDK